MLIAQRTDLILPPWFAKLQWISLVQMIAVPLEAFALLSVAGRSSRAAVLFEIVVEKIGGGMLASAIFVYCFGPLIATGCFWVYFVWFGRRRSAPVK